jgi:HSP20 family molecular chaperone IbpA
MSITVAEQPFSHLARQANKLMDQMQKGFYVYSSETWSPNVNLYETADAYLVCVDLAGVQKEKIDVEVVDQRLRLKGARAVPTFDAAPPSGAPPGPDKPAAAADAGEGEAVGEAVAEAAGESPGESPARRLRVHLMEIDHGPFSREVELPPDVNHERIAATYRNGLLWIEIPKG